MTDTTDLVRRLRFSANGSDYWSLCMEAADRIEQLEQEAAANKQDAMRYRWLRGNAQWTGAGIGVVAWEFETPGIPPRDGQAEGLDAAIDAAMKEKP